MASVTTDLAIFAAFALLPLLPLLASHLLVRRAERLPVEETRIRQARSAVGILFLLGCFAPMALDWIPPLLGFGELGERLGRAAIDAFRRIAGPVGRHPLPFVLLAYILPIFVAFLVTMRLDQRLARALDPGKVKQTLPAGKAAAMLAWIMLPTLLAVAAVFAVQRQLPPASGTAVRAAASLAALIPVLLVFALLAPRSMRLFQEVTPLPDGPLRARLLDLSRRSGVSVREYHRIVNREYDQANAFVVGLLPFQREVFLTPPLLAEEKEEEAVAVVAHEFAHLAARHLHGYLLFSMAWLFLSVGLFSFARIVIFRTDLVPLELIQPFIGILMMSAFFGYFFLLFRHYARRFEAEADRHAAAMLGDAEPLERALRFIYAYNHAPRVLSRFERLFQTHDPLERRLADLAAPAPPRPASKWRFPLAALVAGLSLIAIDEVFVDRPERSLEMAREAALANRAGDHARAEGAARRALALDPENGLAHHAIGVAFHRQGEEETALAALARAVCAKRPFPAARIDLAALLCRRGDPEAALRLLAGERLRGWESLRAAEIMHDIIMYNLKQSHMIIMYMEHYDNMYYDIVCNNMKYNYISSYSYNMYSSIIRNIGMKEIDDLSAADPFSMARESSADAGSRFFPLDAALDAPGRIRLPCDRLLAFVRDEGEREMTGVLFAASGAARICRVDQPFSSRPPRLLLHFSGALTGETALTTAETRFLGIYGERSDPVLLFGATREGAAR